MSLSIIIGAVIGVWAFIFIETVVPEEKKPKAYSLYYGALAGCAATCCVALLLGFN